MFGQFIIFVLVILVHWLHILSKYALQATLYCIHSLVQLFIPIDRFPILALNSTLQIAQCLYLMWLNIVTLFLTARLPLKSFTGMP